MPHDRRFTLYLGCQTVRNTKNRPKSDEKKFFLYMAVSSICLIISLHDILTTSSPMSSEMLHASASSVAWLASKRQHLPPLLSAGPLFTLT